MYDTENVNSVFCLEKEDLFTHLVDGDDYGYHSHDFYEIFYIVSGNITHRLDDKKHTLSDGDMILIPPGIKHEFFRPAVCTHRDIVFSVSFFESVCDFIDKDAIGKLRDISSCNIIRLTSEKMIYLEKILDEFNFNSLFDVENKKAVATAVAANVIMEFINGKTQSKFGSAPLWFNKLMDKFNEQTYIKKGIPLILDTVPYNKIYVERTFKKFTGVSMTEYLNEVRLKLAALRLRSTNSNINDIGENVGFSSPTYFYKQFKKKYGMTPNEYRGKAFRIL